MKKDCPDCFPGLFCTKCENKIRYTRLDIGDKSLIQLYEKALEDQNLELALNTGLELHRLGIDDITVPLNV